MKLTIDAIPQGGIYQMTIELSNGEVFKNNGIEVAYLDLRAALAASEASVAVLKGLLREWQKSDPTSNKQADCNCLLCRRDAALRGEEVQGE